MSGQVSANEVATHAWNLAGEAEEMMRESTLPTSGRAQRADRLLRYAEVYARIADAMANAERSS